MIDEKLKPCPFCGSADVVRMTSSIAGLRPWIECRACHSTALVDMWNKAPRKVDP